MTSLYWQTGLGKTSKSCLCFDDKGLAHGLVKQAGDYLQCHEILWLNG